MIDDILDDDWLTADDVLEELDVSILGDTHPFELMCQHKDYQPDQRHILFVYGTMKRGFTNNNRILSRPGNKYLGSSATTEGCYIMGSRTSSSGLVVPMVRRNYSTGHDIFGEVFDIDGPTLLNIDLAEGVPDIYTRTSITLFVNTELMRANIYLFADYFDSSHEYNRVVTYSNTNGKITPTQEFISTEDYERW